MVHDLLLVVSVSVVGFRALWRCWFVKHSIFICRNFGPYLCDVFPVVFSSCGNCFYAGRSPEGSKELQESFPILGLSVSLLVQRSQDCMDLAIGSISVKQGLSLAHVKPI